MLLPKNIKLYSEEEPEFRDLVSDIRPNFPSDRAMRASIKQYLFEEKKINIVIKRILYLAVLLTSLTINFLFYYYNDFKFSFINSNDNSAETKNTNETKKTEEYSKKGKTRKNKRKRTVLVKDDQQDEINNIEKAEEKKTENKFDRERKSSGDIINKKVELGEKKG